MFQKFCNIFRSCGRKTDAATQRKCVLFYREILKVLDIPYRDALHCPPPPDDITHINQILPMFHQHIWSNRCGDVHDSALQKPANHQPISDRKICIINVMGVVKINQPLART